MSGDPTKADGVSLSNEKAAQRPSGEQGDEAKETARETGITEDQAMQLQRSTDDGAELDSAAEAAARWS